MANIISFNLQELEEKSFHPIVRCTINGDEFFFIVDTGASRTVIDNSLVEDLEPIVDSSEEPFAAGINAERLAVKRVDIPSIQIGAITFNDLPVFTTNLTAISELYLKVAGIKISGLLGCDFLKNHNAVIDFNTSQITIA